MTFWVVRAGRTGEFEETFLSQGLAGIHFGVRPSVAGFDSRESLRENMRSRGAADQVWRFIHDICIGDMVVLPRKRPRVVAVGRVSGDYQYREELDAPHVRPVGWEAQDIPRSAFDQDLLYSMGGLATVFRVRASNAESRISSLLAEHLTGVASAEPGPTPLADEDFEFKVDLEEQIHDRIIDRLRQRFSGTRLEYLVAEILRASGYRALETRQGPDGGIDVVAGQGDMGF